VWLCASDETVNEEFALRCVVCGRLRPLSRPLAVCIVVVAVLYISLLYHRREPALQVHEVTDSAPSTLSTATNQEPKWLSETISGIITYVDVSNVDMNKNSVFVATSQAPYHFFLTEQTSLEIDGISTSVDNLTNVIGRRGVIVFRYRRGGSLNFADSIQIE